MFDLYNKKIEYFRVTLKRNKTNIQNIITKIAVYIFLIVGESGRILHIKVNANDTMAVY